MDQREAEITKAKEILRTTGKLPKELEHMERFFDETPWRKDPKVVAKVKKAARKASRNS
jgi:hypothetical protein